MVLNLKNLKLVLRNDRRLWAAAGAITGILVVWGAAESGREARPLPRSALDEAPTSMSDNDQYRDLIVAYQTDISNNAERITRQEENLTRVQNDLKQHREQVTSIFNTVLDQTEGIALAVRELKERPVPVGSEEPPPRVPEPLASPEPMQVWGFDDRMSDPPRPVPPRAMKYLFISPGDSVSVRLLTGVGAAVDGTPAPAVFKLTGPISGPDGSALDLGEARLVAAAVGNANDGRALFRLTDLAIRHADGRRSVVKVDGWVVGEDGVRGIKGALNDKLGQLVAASSAYSFVAALTDRVTQKTDSVVVNGSGVEIRSEDLNAASSSAMSDAARRLTGMLLEHYEKYVPSVEVLANREVAAVFSQPAEVGVWEEDFSADGQELWQDL